MTQNKLFNKIHNASISLKKNVPKKLLHRRDSLVYYTSLSEYIYIIQYIRPSTSYIHTKWMNETLMFMSWSMAKKASKNQDNVFWLGSILCSTFEMGPKKIQVTSKLLQPFQFHEIIFKISILIRKNHKRIIPYKMSVFLFYHWVKILDLKKSIQNF